MRKNFAGEKSVSSVKRGSMMVCPHCGHEDFVRKEGFSLLGQQFVCAKCKGTFRKANLVRVKTTDVHVAKQGSTVGSGRGKRRRRR